MARKVAKTKSEKKQERAYKRALNSTSKNMEKLSTLYNDTMLNIDSRVSGPNLINSEEIKKLDNIVKNVVNDEVENIEAFAGEDISRFLVSIFDDNGENNVGDKGYIESVDKLLKTENGEVLNFFQERYKNRYYLFDDLKLIADQLYQLKDALLTYRDSIVTSDDLSSEIAAKKEFRDTNDDKEKELLKKTEVMENELKLEGRLRNHLIPKTLNYGEYLVYTLPYSAILAKYNKSQEQNKARVDSMNTTSHHYNTIGVKESTRFDDAVRNSTKPKTNINEEPQLDILTESSEDFLHIKNKFVDTDHFGQVSASQLTNISKNILSDMNNIISHINVIEDDSTDLILESSLDEAMEYIKSKKVAKEFNTNRGGKGNKSKLFYADSLLDMTPSGKEASGFENEKGCYIKLVEPTKMIPIKLLNDAVIGYLYLYSDDIQLTTMKKGGIQNNQMVPSYLDSLVKGREDLEKEMVSKIVGQVIKKFNKNWFANNKQFKQVITDALIFDDLYRKDVQFQFVPAEYVTHFKINLEEDGNGVSILQDALFPAKLYLALLMFKYLTIMNKSNDRTIYYVKNSGIEKDIAKTTQNVVRQVKMKQMNITDLMNTQVMNSKLGANKDIFMPVGQSDIRPIDMDILSGQDVQLDTPLMEELKKQFLNATGVPSVLQEFIDQADYAKTLVMANAKFVSRVISLQAEFNDSITELYKKLLLYCTDMDPVDISRFKFTFSSPKDVNLVNTTDRISSVEATVNIMMDAKYGREHEENSEEYKRVKDYVYGTLIKENFPNLPWDLMDKAHKDFEITAKRLEEEKKMREAEPTSPDSGSDMGGGDGQY